MTISYGDCPARNPGRFDMTAPATLYYVRFNTRHGRLYKIGVTNRALNDRFTPKERAHMTVIRTQRYKLGKWAKAFERQIKDLFTDDRYTGPDVLRAGNSELFTRDVLNLDRFADRY